MTTPQITPPGTPPDPLSPQPTFRATFYAYLQALVTAFGEQNAMATWMNSTADDVSTDAGTATTEASTATTKAGEALASANAAAQSESNAADSETAAQTAESNLNAVYLGESAADPTSDLNGDPLTAGAFYFNTSNGTPRIYNGSNFVTAVLDANGAMMAANNLSDVANAATARTNLGLLFGATAALATQGEAEAGTNNTKTVTPLRVAQAIEALAGGGTKVTEFLSSGLFTKDADSKAAIFLLWGGGGGGASNGNSGGGGGGACVFGIMDASDLSASETVTIGAGGSNTGGNSTFAGATAYGGAGASSSTGGGAGGWEGAGSGSTGGGPSDSFGGGDGGASANAGAKSIFGGGGGGGNGDAGGASIFGGGGGAGDGSTAGESTFGGDGGAPSSAGEQPGGGGGGGTFNSAAVGGDGAAFIIELLG